MVGVELQVAEEKGRRSGRVKDHRNTGGMRFKVEDKRSEQLCVENYEVFRGRRCCGNNNVAAEIDI
jgi:hypothetical protein